MSDQINIHQQASNIGYTKGSPRGSGHGGFVIGGSDELSTPEKIRHLYSQGKVVLFKSKDGSNYVFKDFLAGNELSGAFICPLKIKSAKNNDVTPKLSAIVSTIDRMNIKDIDNILGVFDSDEQLANFVLNKNVNFESISRFDDTINNIYRSLI